MADGDKDNLVAMLRKSMPYVTLTSCQLFNEVDELVSRTALVYEQMPWLMHYTQMMPSFGQQQNLNQLYAIAMNRTMERYKDGSSSKDILYYLVSVERILV